MEIQSRFKVSEAVTTYRPLVKSKERPVISNSKSCYDVIREFIKIEDQGHIERTYVMLLASNNSVLGISLLSTGGLDGCIVDPKQVFQKALTGNAASIILWHNHPSGNLKPSSSDRETTKKLKDGGKLLDICVLDHLIITDSDGEYLSMSDYGII